MVKTKTRSKNDSIVETRISSPGSVVCIFILYLSSRVLLKRVECCLSIPCDTRTFWQANGATVIPQRRQVSSGGFAPGMSSISEERSLLQWHIDYTPAAHLPL